jgi:hypothetical protein
MLMYEEQLEAVGFTNSILEIDNISMHDISQKEFLSQHTL